MIVKIILFVLYKFSQERRVMYLQTQATFPILTLATISLKDFSFHGIYLNETIEIQVSESAIATTSLKAMF